MTHEELQALLNTDITRPHPDPAWDYYTIWDSLWKVKNQISELTTFISDQEVAKPDTDVNIRNKLASILLLVVQAQELISDTDFDDDDDDDDDYPFS